MKTRHVVAVLLLLVLPSLSFGQTQPPKPDWPTITWKPGAPGTDLVLMQGHEVKTFTHANGTMIAVLLNDDGRYLAFLVFVVNKSPQRFVVNPVSFFAKIETPKPMLLLAIPVEKVAKSTESEGRWRSTLGMFLSGMATRQTTGTITDQQGNQSTVTLAEPNTQAQSAAQRNARERSADNRSRADIMRDIGLRANTVFPQTSLAGWVFFEKKKFTSLTIGVFTGLAMYEFPFTKR
jgi:hypothetical protein